MGVICSAFQFGREPGSAVEVFRGAVEVAVAGGFFGVGEEFLCAAASGCFVGVELGQIFGQGGRVVQGAAFLFEDDGVRRWPHGAAPVQVDIAAVFAGDAEPRL